MDNQLIGSMLLFSARQCFTTYCPPVKCLGPKDVNGQAMLLFLINAEHQKEFPEAVQKWKTDIEITHDFSSLEEQEILTPHLNFAMNVNDVIHRSDPEKATPENVMNGLIGVMTKDPMQPFEVRNDQILLLESFPLLNRDRQPDFKMAF